MKTKEKFECIIIGRPKAEDSIEKFRSRVQKIMIQVDPEMKISTRHFAKMKYVLQWYGKPSNMERVDDVYRAAVKLAARYLNDWEFEIAVMYEEKSEGV